MTSPRYNLHKTGVTVCGKTNCTVLLPDGWKWEGAVGTTGWQDGGYSEETQVKWSTMEAAGAVCLPAAGYRDNYDAYVNNIGNSGHYWSSTANGEDEAYLEDFDMGPDCIEGRYNGFSVRLVTNVN